MKSSCDVFEEMAMKWPSAVVARTQIEAFSGGMISSKYIANLDSLGLGPERVKLQRKVGYPVRSLAKWMRARANS